MQALVYLLDMGPGTLVLLVGPQPVFQRQPLRLAKIIALGLDQPVHGLLRHLWGKRGVHWAK